MMTQKLYKIACKQTQFIEKKKFLTYAANTKFSRKWKNETLEVTPILEQEIPSPPIDFSEIFMDIEANLIATKSNFTNKMSAQK